MRTENLFDNFGGTKELSKTFIRIFKMIISKKCENQRNSKTFFRIIYIDFLLEIMK